MTHLKNISSDELRNALDEVDEVRPTKRLMVAIAYKQGVSQTELAEWYGLSRKTVYNWLRRFDEGKFHSTASDKPRPGRPPKLSYQQKTEVYKNLKKSPKNFGFDADEWCISILQRHLKMEFDVEYSYTSVHRLLERG